MKRSAANDMGSLELLLDTMCNTFGCLIFISILLAILTQQIGESIVKDMDPTRIVRDLREATVTIKELEGDVVELQQQLASLAEPIELPPAADLTDEHGRAKQEYQDACDEHDAAAAAAGAARTRRDDARKTHDELALELANLRQGGSATQQTFGVPRERRLGERSSIMHFAFSNGRIYAITKFPGNAGLDLTQVNAERGIAQANGREIIAVKVTLKPNAGTEVPLDGPLPRTVTRALNGIPSDGMIEFHVDKNSFLHFLRVRNQLLERDARPPYNWMPTDTSEPLIFQAGGDRVGMGY